MNIMISRTTGIALALVITLLPACDRRCVSTHAPANITVAATVDMAKYVKIAGDNRQQSKASLTELSWQLAENPAAQPAFIQQLAACLSRSDRQTAPCAPLLAVLDGINEKLAQNALIDIVNESRRGHASQGQLRKICTFLAERAIDESALATLNSSGAACRGALASARLHLDQSGRSLTMPDNSVILLSMRSQNTDPMQPALYPRS